MKRNKETRRWAGKLQIQFDVISIDFAIHLVAFVADKLQTQLSSVVGVFPIHTHIYIRTFIFWLGFFLCLAFDFDDAWHF